MSYPPEVDNDSPLAAEIRAWAEAAGYEASPASLYDEEGVEGWRWNGPAGEEWDAIGDWYEPPTIPDGLYEAYQEACNVGTAPVSE